VVRFSDGERLRQCHVDHRLKELRLIIWPADEREAVAELRRERISPIVSGCRGQWAVSHDEVEDDGKRRYDRRPLIGPHTRKVDQASSMGEMQ
jgi:hypothetical protein